MQPDYHEYAGIPHVDDFQYETYHYLRVSKDYEELTINGVPHRRIVVAQVETVLLRKRTTVYAKLDWKPVEIHWRDIYAGFHKRNIYELRSKELIDAIEKALASAEPPTSGSEVKPIYTGFRGTPLRILAQADATIHTINGWEEVSASEANP